MILANTFINPHCCGLYYIFWKQQSLKAHKSCLHDECPVAVSVFDVKTQNNPLCEHQCEWCCTYLKHVACVVLGQMRDRRSRALAFLSPRQSTDGKSYYKYKLTRASASATATPLLTISNVLGRGQFSRGIRFKSIGGRSVSRRFRDSC